MQNTKAQEIVEVSVEQLIQKLTKAYVDEWMASYQYWVGAITVRGFGRAAVSAELAIHANEEMAHAKLLADRIVTLGGKINIMPVEWEKMGGCHYNAIKSDLMKPTLEENLKGEQCAIQFYNDLLKFVAGKDLVTYNIVLQILNDEIEHEQDLLSFLEDTQVTSK